MIHIKNLKKHTSVSIKKIIADKRLLKKLILLSLILYSSFFYNQNIFIAAQIENEVTSSLNLAEKSIEMTYISIFEAEEAGGDVSELVSRLNFVLIDLVHARKAFKSGYYDDAIKLSENVIGVSTNILDDAVEIKRLAKVNNANTFRITVFLTLLSITSICVVGFVGWNRFKFYYFKKISRMKVEISENET